MKLGGLRIDLDGLIAQRLEELQCQSTRLDRRTKTIEHRGARFQKYGRIGKYISTLCQEAALDLIDQQKETQKAIRELSTLRTDLSDSNEIDQHLPTLEKMYHDMVSDARDIHYPIPGQVWCHDSEPISKLNDLILKVREHYKREGERIPAFI